MSEAIRAILLDKGTKLSDATNFFFISRGPFPDCSGENPSGPKKGKVVICDRFEDSTLAYQGYGRKLPFALIRDMNRVVRGTLKPMLTFVLDVDIRRGLQRGGRYDRIERESFSFHQRVRSGFLKLAEQEPERMTVIDGSRPLPEVSRLVLEKLKSVFG